MLDAQEQLARLRRRIANIDAKYARAKKAAPPPALEIPRRCFVEEWAEGQVVTNEFGEHFETEREISSQKPHGSADIGALFELPETLLDVLAAGEFPAASAARWAFLDTETTGQAEASGTYAFLIGVGRITQNGFSIRQFFMREYAEERSVLAALADHLRDFDVLITYNGKAYDQPLLETRYRLTRQKHPFSRLAHIDLLHGARRLWKLRLESCRLIQLEQEILGFYREGDLPGELIPYVYFEYLRSHEAQRLISIFHHNAMDILSLACLTAIVPAAFGATDAQSLERLGLRRGEELAGIARWLVTAKRPEAGLELFRRAIEAGLPDKLLFEVMWEMGLVEKRLGNAAAALAVFTELAGCRNDYRASALEELSKHYEHRERDFAAALDFVSQALAHHCSDSLQRRKQRLEKRLVKHRAAQRLA